MALSRFPVLIFVLSLLAACDAPAGEEGAAGRTSADSLPAVSGAAAPGMEVDGGSMDESSPGGEAVTESELPPQSDVPPPPRDVFSDADCTFEEWIEKPVDEAAIKALARPYRILKPGSMMTMDHSPERINVEHDDKNTVTRVWCG
jgi:hypothetical protein